MCFDQTLTRLVVRIYIVFHFSEGHCDRRDQTRKLHENDAASSRSFQSREVT